MHLGDQTYRGFSLMAAIASHDAVTVRKLLAAETSDEERKRLVNFADYDYRTPLHLACSEGLVAIARELLKYGADWNAADRFGVSCVQDAMRHGRVEVLRVLGEFNASFPDFVQATHVDPRYTLGRDLMVVVGEGNLNAAGQLVRCFGANVNFANADGRTPLHIAVVRGDADMVRYLLDAGADVQKTDRWGISALEEARRDGSKDIVEIITKHEAAIVAHAHETSAKRVMSFPVC